MASITASQFLDDFPEFSTIDTSVITRFLRRAQLYISIDDLAVPHDVGVLMLELMTAHILTTSYTTNTTSNSTTGFVQSSSVQNVSVSIATPNFDDDYDYWLTTSQYGLELIGLIKSHASLMYLNGSPTRVL